MTNNSQQYIYEVTPNVAPCRNCGFEALITRLKLKPVPRYIHQTGPQPAQGTPVEAYVLCMRCLRRDLITWDPTGKNHTVEHIAPGEGQRLAEQESPHVADSQPDLRATEPGYPPVG